MSTAFKTEASRALHSAWEMSQDLVSQKIGIIGYGIVHLCDEFGDTKELIPFANKITDVGDTYYANRAVFAINTNGISAPTAAWGMQYGSGSATPAKADPGASTGAIVSGSGQVFDSTYPNVVVGATTTGTVAVYKVTWAAGTAVYNGITEAVVTTLNSASTGSNASQTISRVTFSAVNKGSSDTLAITWNHRFLGS